MTCSATFWSSDGDRVYTVEVLGNPPASLTCTCNGYENLKTCKHINAILVGENPLLAMPTPIDGYVEACEALHNSPARLAYLEMQDDLREIERQEKLLKAQRTAIKKSFYNKLARGF